MATFDKTTVFADPFGSMLDGFRQGESDAMKAQKHYLEMMRSALALQKALGASGRGGGGGRRTGKTLNLSSGSRKGSVPKAVSAGSSTSLGVPAGLGLTGGGTISADAAFKPMSELGFGMGGVGSTESAPAKDTAPIFGKNVLDRLGLTSAAEADPVTMEKGLAPPKAPVPFSASVTSKADNATLARGLKDYLAGVKAPGYASPSGADETFSDALKRMTTPDPTSVGRRNMAALGATLKDVLGPVYGVNSHVSPPVLTPPDSTTPIATPSTPTRDAKYALSKLKVIGDLMGEGLPVTRIPELYTSPNPETQAFLDKAYKNYKQYRDPLLYMAAIRDAIDMDKAQERINAYAARTAK